MKKSILKLFTLSLFLSSFSTFKIFSQTSFFDNYVFQSWNTIGNLSGATATDIIQTRDGYLNIGTYEGLIRFDGVAFKTIRRGHNNDYKFASVRAVLEDSNGNLWIGSNDEGLQKISKNGNKIFSTQNGLPNTSVRALAEDRMGNIWIGTAAGIVYLTPQGHLITPQFQAGTVSKGIIASSIFCDTAGRIWLITANEKGLFLFSDGLFRNLPELEPFGNYLVSCIAQDLNGNFWIGLGDQGLIQLNNGKITRVKTNTALDNMATWAIYVGNDGTIWFGTDKGVYAYNNGIYNEYKSSTVSNAKINKLICDREGSIWIATDRCGIGKLTHGKFKVTKLGAASNAIAEGLDGKIWVGTDKGIVCYENEKQVSNALTEYTKGLRIRHVETAMNGDILVSCYSKPSQIRYGRHGIKNWTTDDGLAGDKVRVAIETKPDELYVGTTTGLSIIHQDGKIRTYKQVDGLENEYVMCLYKDSNGIIWIGTDGGGIFLMKNEAIISHISSEDGLSGNVIFKITQDKDEVYWICTGGGITTCKPFDSAHNLPTELQSINSDQGIGTDSVFQAIFDTAGNTWLTSNFGIASIPTTDLLTSLSTKAKALNIKFYNQNDGLESGGPNSTAKSICDKHGRIWFTMVDGIAVYDPIKIRENPIMPLVHIESVTVDNIENVEIDKEIILHPGTKRVDIKYTGISFDAPERIQFTHMLTNFENTFSTPSEGRIVSYTNLKPGKHTFLVNAINGDGIMSEQAETMLFVQKPYFYQVVWFWVAFGIILLGFFLILFYHKQKAMLREKQRLEQMVLERTEQLEKAKNKSDYLLRSILPDKIADELRDEIHSIGENFSDVTLLFSDIVGFTNTSSGHTAEEIVDALNNLFSRFDERAKLMGVEKIKTIGDAYMAACGVPVPKENNALILVEFAKGMYEDLADYNKTAKIPFQIRIGLNSGPVTAGVIGKTKFIYDVWGDTVNVASRMETACTPGGIRITEDVHQKLMGSLIKFSEPIECDIKGKGKMITYEIIK